jgi:hypothetical protein
MAAQVITITNGAVSGVLTLTAPVTTLCLTGTFTTGLRLRLEASDNGTNYAPVALTPDPWEYTSRELTTSIGPIPAGWRLRVVVVSQVQIGHNARLAFE